MRRNTIYRLTIAGLIPFCIGTLYQLVPEVLPPWNWISLITPYYGAIILSFLGGIQWGLSLLHTNTITRKWLVVSNVIALMAFASLLLPSRTMTLVILLIGYGAALAVDLRLFQLVAPPSGYRNLRVTITVIVCGLLLTSIMFS
ncbi:MAG: hypothetical protein CMF55_04845 [Legionellales bacterium]|nr:hypothetical protein [Legionellales bacterium]